MDPVKELQVILEESLIELNKEAMTTLAAQIAATVRQLQNGEPSKVALIWTEKNTPAPIKEFIIKEFTDPYEYAVLLPTGGEGFYLASEDFSMVKLQLPQNILLIYYYK